MVITRYGAQRFSGLEEDVNNLPIDADLLGAIFNSTDTLKFFIFNGTVWNESAGGGGITGLETNSTILEHSTDIEDYTTPTSATATSESPVISLTELKSYWRFEEITTPVINQASISGSVDGLSDADIAVTAGIFQQPGIIDFGLEFNGSTSFGNVGTSLSQYNFLHQANEQWSIVLWYRKLDGLWNATRSFMDDTNAQNGTGIFIQGLATGILRFVLQDGASNEITFSSAASFLPDDTNFHMITVTGDYTLGSNQIIFTLDDGTPQSGGLASGHDAGNALNIMQIMQLNNGLQRLDAVVDEWSIWNRVLTSGEITTLFNSGNGLGVSKSPSLAIDGSDTTFWQSDAGINESITLDMGGIRNMYALSYFIEKAEITETQIQIKTIGEDAAGNPVWGVLSNRVIENFTTYADQTEMDSLWVTTDTATMRGNLSTNVLDFDALRDSSNDSIAYDLVPLSDTAWVLDWKITFSANSGDPMLFIVLSDEDQTSSDNTAQTGLGMRFRPGTGNAAERTGIISFLNETPFSQSGGSQDDGVDFVPTLATDYFFRMIRVDATNYTLEWFLNSFRTGVPVGSLAGTCNASISNLQFFKLMNFSQDTASASLIGTMDDLVLYNGVNTVPQNAGQVLRTIEIADLAEGQNFIRFNGVTAQQIQIEGSSDSSLVMAANELAVLIESDPPLTTKHGQFIINGTNASLPLNGGDPTTSVIDDPVTNSMTLVSAVEQNDPPTDGMVMWNEILDANNSVSHSKMKIDGAIKNVRWF